MRQLSKSPSTTHALVAAAAACLAMFAAGCGSESADSPQAATISSTTIEVTTTTSTPPAPPPVEVAPPEPLPESVLSEPDAVDCSQPMQAPTDQFGAPMSNGTSICATVVECADISEHYEFGTAHMSDGSLMYTSDCNAYNQQQKAQQQETPADPGTTAGRGYTCDDSGCTYPDGLTVPGYQRCGVGCGEAPTSGDVQGGWVACLDTGATMDQCREQLGN
ncbi:hypothetical protein E5720_16725 [Rhodococcus sp. PAMC28707]|uniref:hypothetical protein n=1 Tax=unclassified Rhodococcus (in: high G+C Gram-positive bacteria) TaxID=192944 RepID=UPI00109D840C|nr:MULTISPECIES: hypothetical protein [unclassified Rhodococcus (in: high G+C Gram-positive bacteria)]QCB51938.1 hypothetical protein E5769_18795 [Rhodococcus sp. PAMC28705]QCB59892.1 hypothetical protein E5720_16725 [Rhodococcus sp. PAMC28707]